MSRRGADHERENNERAKGDPWSRISDAFAAAFWVGIFAVIGTVAANRADIARIDQWTQSHGDSDSGWFETHDRDDSLRARALSDKIGANAAEIRELSEQCHRTRRALAERLSWCEATLSKPGRLSHEHGYDEDQ